VRVLASALSVLALGSPATAPKVAYLNGTTLFVNGKVIARQVRGAPRWSGDGKLLSVGQRVLGGPTLGNGSTLSWAPAGETAAYFTRHGGLGIWTPQRGKRLSLPDGWGATTVAWNADGSIAIGRSVCRGACGRAVHEEVWVRDVHGSMRRIAGPLMGDQIPMPFAWWAGKPLWWDWPGSGSIAADGVFLYSGDARIASGLMYEDYVSVCGNSIAVATGGDRYAMDGKRILFNGADVSRDHSRSWVSPSCAADGAVVAAASANTVPPRIGREHRSIWRLLPSRKQLTHPRVGRTDEYPHVLADGSLLFVRTRTVSRALRLYGVGTIEWLHNGTITPLGTASGADNYYGHYDWPDVVAIAP
jgi:hypothetical protein